MRIAMFFLYAFGFMIGLPALVLFFVQRAIGPLQYPPPPAFTWDPAWFANDNRAFKDPVRLLGAKGPVMDLRQIIPYATAAAASVNMDGTLLAAASFKTQEEADRGVADLAAQYRLKQIGEAAGGWRVQSGNNEMEGRVLRDERRVIVALGLKEESALQRLAITPGLAMVPGHSGKLPSSGQLWMVFGGVMTWALLQFFIFGRVASWAGGVPPVEGVQPVAAEQLMSRLLAVNSMKVPFTVSAGKEPNEIFIDWRYADATWFDLMRVHKMSKAYRLVLRLDPDDKKVRAMEQMSELDLSAGLSAASLDWKTSYGINFFHYSYQRVFGLQIKDGKLTMDPSYAYTFNLQELKQPIIDIVRSAGWDYRPVITFFRPIGG